MFGVTRKPQRKHHAKTVLPPGPPSQYPTQPCQLPPAAQSQLSLGPPPPYALVYPSQHLLPPQQPLLRPLPPPPPPRLPARSLPHRPKAQPSKLAVHAKPPKNQSPSKASKQSRAPPTVNRNGNDSSKPFEQWHENTIEPMADRALCDLISSKFSSVITSIDGEEFSGDVRDLEISDEGQANLRGGWGSTSREVSRRADKAISSAVISTNYFSKVNLYANSKLPPNLPTLQL